MDTEIVIRVTARTAEPVGSPSIICGNGDYTVRFIFDSDWALFPIKTVRFEWLDTMTGQRRHIDSIYAADAISIPPIPDAYELNIGVYAGTLETQLTSTPARIPCERCITDGATYHGDTTPDVYQQLLDAMASMPSSATEPVRVKIKALAALTAGTFDIVEIPQTRGSQYPQYHEEEQEER